jgi:tetrahydromethanopterin S-methyltransferase subunit F
MRCRRHIATPERPVGGADRCRAARHDVSVDRQPIARDHRNRRSLVIAGWIGFAVGVAVVVVVLATSSRRRYQHPDLGSVSDQWIAEQRLGQGHDPQR